MQCPNCDKIRIGVFKPVILCNPTPSRNCLSVTTFPLDTEAIRSELFDNTSRRMESDKL